MFDVLISPFLEFEFMRRALIGCLALSLTAGPVGTFLMLRRMSLFGDAMAHAILPGAALGYLAFGLSLTAMTIGGLATGLLLSHFACSRCQHCFAQRIKYRSLARALWLHSRLG